jgi:hypothetical protein
LESKEENKKGEGEKRGDLSKKKKEKKEEKNV